MGNALRFTLSVGQRHDITQAYNLIEGFNFERVIADTAYDAEHFLETIRQVFAEAIIPPRSNRKELREIDRHLYKERHLAECFIGKLKHFRRVFSRFDKLAKNYLSFIHFASSLIWLR